MNKVALTLLLLLIHVGLCGQDLIDQEGAIVRSDTTKKIIYLCFTGHDFDDGF